jgi:hypothetical protein
MKPLTGKELEYFVDSMSNTECIALLLLFLVLIFQNKSLNIAKRKHTNQFIQQLLGIKDDVFQSLTMQTKK